MAVCDIICLGVDRCVDTEVVSADGITFRPNDGSDIYSYDVCFYDLNVGKFVGSLLDESIEYNDGTLLDLYNIDRHSNPGVRRSVSRGIGIRLGIDFGRKFETADDGEIGSKV